MIEFRQVDAHLVLGIANAHHRRPITSSLHRRLAESGWVREFAVIENVVEIEALDARLEAIERLFLKRFGVDFIINIQASDII